MLIAARSRADEPRPEPPVVVTGPPPPVAAPPDPASDEPVVKETRKDGAFEVSVGVTTFSAALNDVRFRGQGVPRGSTARINFAQNGRELGISTPRFWGGEVRAGYLRRYLMIGVSGFVASNGGGADAQPTRPDLAVLVNPSQASTRRHAPRTVDAPGGFRIPAPRTHREGWCRTFTRSCAPTSRWGRSSSALRELEYGGHSQRAGRRRWRMS